MAGSESTANSSRAGRRAIDRYRRLADGSTILAATREAVRHAASRVPVAVVRGHTGVRSSRCSEAPASPTRFGMIVAADDVARGKPHPESYLLALEALGDGLAPSDVVAFEDTEAGIASATRRRAALHRRARDAPGRSGSPRPRAIVDAIDVELVALARRMTCVIAHRGASAEERENTLPAFERAIELGADFVELDVQAAADGALVVFHDLDLDRLTPLRGPLQAPPARGAARARLPTLEEVLELDTGADRRDGGAQAPAISSGGTT